MANEFNRSLPAFYTDWSVDYDKQFRNELSYKPLDRELLQEIVTCSEGGLICDLGCGPGHISEFLVRAGGVVEGIDISEGMVALAAARLPDMTFKPGSFYDIPAANGRYQSVVAFYSIIHAEKSRLTDVVREVERVLVPGGRLLASFHEGPDHVVKDNVVFNFFQPSDIEKSVRDSGLRVERLISRESYPEEGGDWRRLYVVAEKPA